MISPRPSPVSRQANRSFSLCFQGGRGTVIIISITRKMNRTMQPGPLPRKEDAVIEAGLKFKGPRRRQTHRQPGFNAQLTMTVLSLSGLLRRRKGCEYSVSNKQRKPEAAVYLKTQPSKKGYLLSPIQSSGAV